MFKAMIVICVISQFNAENGASCFLFSDEALFKQLGACMAHGQTKKMTLVQEVVERSGNKMAVIGQSTCIKEEQI